MWPSIEISLNRPRIIDYYRSVWPGGAAPTADAVSSPGNDLTFTHLVNLEGNRENQTFRGKIEKLFLLNFDKV